MLSSPSRGDYSTEAGDAMRFSFDQDGAPACSRAFQRKPARLPLESGVLVLSSVDGDFVWRKIRKIWYGAGLKKFGTSSAQRLSPRCSTQMEKHRACPSLTP